MNIVKEFVETDWTFKEIAEAVGIDPEKYENLMTTRFDGEKEGKDFHLDYAAEWATRIKHETHYAAADRQTEKVLEEAGYKK